MRHRTREQITIKQVLETEDGAGGYVSNATPTTIGTYFCSVQRVNAGQRSEEGREFLEDTLVFRTRYGVFDVNNTDALTVTYRSKEYKINSTRNGGLIMTKNINNILNKLE